MSEVGEKIPVDSLVISRKVMSGSTTTIHGKVNSTIRELGLDRVSGVGYRDEKHVGVELLGDDEFAERRFKHSLLGVRSVLSLVEGINTSIKYDREGLNSYISGVPLGEATFDDIGEGLFVVGFMTNPEFRERMNGERTEVVDMMLDSAGLDLVDPFRMWRNTAEEDDFWIPALRVSTTDPAAERMLDELTDSLTEAAKSIAVDILDAVAKPVVTELPIDYLPEQYQ